MFWKSTLTYLNLHNNFNKLFLLKHGFSAFLMFIFTYISQGRLIFENIFLNTHSPCGHVVTLSKLPSDTAMRGSRDIGHWEWYPEKGNRPTF